MLYFYSSEFKWKKQLGEIRWFPANGIIRVAEGFAVSLTAEPLGRPHKKRVQSLHIRDRSVHTDSGESRWEEVYHE